ncbi:MAG: hypothetical protein NVSMB68_04020 [Thermoanaerobaculia bacterium]
MSDVIPSREDGEESGRGSAATLPDSSRSPALGMTRRVLIAGVGYRNLRDMSLGPLLIDRLQESQWPEGTEVEDLSYGPIAIMHSFDERPRYDRMVFISGAKRGGQPGQIYRSQWKHQLPDEDEIHQRVVEAITGVVDLENLLIVTTYFKKLPADVVVFEVEAEDDSFGEAMTPVVENAIPQLIEQLRAAAGAP